MLLEPVNKSCRREKHKAKIQKMDQYISAGLKPGAKLWDIRAIIARVETRSNSEIHPNAFAAPG